MIMFFWYRDNTVNVTYPVFSSLLRLTGQYLHQHVTFTVPFGYFSLGLNLKLAHPETLQQLITIGPSHYQYAFQRLLTSSVVHCVVHRMGLCSGHNPYCHAPEWVCLFRLFYHV